MTTPRLRAIEALLTQTTLFRALPMDGIVLLLDARDSREFDSAWQRASAEVHSEGTDLGVAAQTLNRLRERAFKAAFEISGSADVAGYVCDDFELILLCELTRTANAFVEELWTTYERGGFPTGQTS